MRTRVRWILWFPIALHLAWGVVLLWAPEAVRATPIYHLWQWTPFRSVPLLAAMLLGVSVLAGIGLLRGGVPRGWDCALILPQQAFLFLSAAGCITAVWAGHYPDGTVVSRAHLFADQWWEVPLAALHFMGFLDLYFWQAWADRKAAPEA